MSQRNSRPPPSPVIVISEVEPSIFLHTPKPVHEICLQSIKPDLAGWGLLWCLWWPDTSYDGETEASHGDVQVVVTRQVQSPTMGLLEMLAQTRCPLPYVRFKEFII